MNHIPRKRFGQNFLKDQRVIENIVEEISPRLNDNMVEIGPGQGALTFALLPQVNHLDVIEIDRDLVEALIKRNEKKLTIYSADALMFDFASLNKKDLRIVGNLPYNISTPLIFHLLTFTKNIFDMHFMLQKEVVERLCAKTSTADYGRLSVMVQYFCEVEYLLDVPPEAFYPKPAVDSAIVRLIPKHELLVKNINNFSELVKQAFSQRRKTLRNNLKPMVSDEVFKKLAIDPQRRAETLSVNEFVAIANALN
jgi:16S rRNA (adenine1518-N6/adenine1519-N6)-dimethyltransferase